MPSISFEVWCGTCGAGLCNETSEVNGGIEVNACESCIETAREEIRDDLESQIQALQERLDELE